MSSGFKSVLKLLGKCKQNRTRSPALLTLAHGFFYSGVPFISDNSSSRNYRNSKSNETKTSKKTSAAAPAAEEGRGLRRSLSCRVSKSVQNQMKRINHVVAKTLLTPHHQPQMLRWMDSTDLSATKADRSSVPLAAAALPPKKKPLKRRSISTERSECPPTKRALGGAQVTAVVGGGKVTWKPPTPFRSQRSYSLRGKPQKHQQQKQQQHVAAAATPGSAAGVETLSIKRYETNV